MSRDLYLSTSSGIGSAERRRAWPKKVGKNPNCPMSRGSASWSMLTYLASNAIDSCCILRLDRKPIVNVCAGFFLRLAQFVLYASWKSLTASSRTFWGV
jgi:hypothetical protein